MTQVPEENPFKSPAEPQGSRKGHVKTAYWGTLIGTILVVIAVYPFAPGISMIVASIGAAGFLRTFFAMRRVYAAEGVPIDSSLQLQMLGSSALLAVPILIASAIAFYAVCLGGTIVAMPIASKASGGDDPYGISGFLFVGIPLGAVVGIAVFTVCLRWSLWLSGPKPKKVSKQQTESSDMPEVTP